MHQLTPPKVLLEFLVTERKNILLLCAAKLLDVSGVRSTSPELEAGLPTFYDELVQVLSADQFETPAAVDSLLGSVHRECALRRGRESLRLGYTISQVVHGYGALCQAITEYAARHCLEPIDAREFNRLNFCLDVAIAEAVTEFTRGSNESTADAELQRLGFLAHELRNALASATTAHQMIRSGVVGAAGSTNRLLENAHLRMQHIIDRSLAEVRLRGATTVDRQCCRVVDAVGEVEATALPLAAAKHIRLRIEVAPDLLIFADRHLIVSALSNLVNNAIKFTRPNGMVQVSASGTEERVQISVRDECGGLPPGKIETLFQPYVQKAADKSGVGLGLSISRRAVELNSGTISAVDLPGQGCCFSINLPRFLS